MAMKPTAAAAVAAMAEELRPTPAAVPAALPAAAPASFFSLAMLIGAPRNRIPPMTIVEITFFIPIPPLTLSLLIRILFAAWDENL
jgi:hypothetical protein